REGHAEPWTSLQHRAQGRAERGGPTVGEDDGAGREAFREKVEEAAFSLRVRSAIVRGGCQSGDHGSRGHRREDGDLIAQTGHGRKRTRRGPRRLVTKSGRRRHTRGPHAYARSSGDGGAATALRPARY